MVSFHTTASTIKSLVDKATVITLLAHYKPDADALGACHALSLYLQALGKKTEIIFPGGGKDSLPYTINNAHEGRHTLAPDLLISCDTPVIERLYFPASFINIPHASIDHHMHYAIPATVALVETTATSTCELVYRLLAHWQAPITPTMANALLFGIMCDTLNFKVPSTSAQTLRIAADLIDHGAQLAELNKGLITHHNPKVLALWGTLLAGLKHSDDNSVIWTTCSAALLASHGLDESALTGFINVLAQTLNNDVSILFYEHQTASHASLRSKGTNVNAIARHFGGGGHILASGITSKLPLDELEKQVIAYLL